MSSPSTPSPTPAELPLSGVARLDHLGVLRASGADATAFLQGQLTHDVALLGADTARLAAYCNAKGRMQASFVVIKRRADELLLVCPRDVLPGVRKRLAMFVLRAKVQLDDASADWTLLGLAGRAAAALPTEPWRRTDQAAGESLAHAVTLYPADGVPLALWLAPAGAPLPQAPELPAEAWRWAMVRSGIALVGQATFEAFVPQMLNYESVDGVSFKKGCYPGQEVVARSQFRGTLKRRGYRVQAQAPLAAGMEVFAASDPSQPCGQLAEAAAHPQGALWDAFASLQVSVATGADTLHAGSPDGPVLSLLPLPYLLRDDI